MSLTARAVLLALIVVCAIAGWWRLTAYYDRRGYQRAQAEARQAAEEQTARNRDLIRAAELRYTVQAPAREEFIAVTVKEVRHETQNLAACMLTPAAVGRLRDAAACAVGDSAAACGADQPMRNPG